MRDEMRHAVRAHDRQRRVEAALAKHCYLLQRAGLEHDLETRVDPRLQGLSFRREEYCKNVLLIEDRRRTRGMERDETFTGRLEDLERAQDALRVARPQSRRGRRIAAHEAGMEVSGRNACRARAHLARTSSGTGGIAESPCVRALK